MRFTILAASVLGVAACTTQTDIPAPASYIANKHPKAIWVESATTMVRVDNPHVDDGTILGVRDGRPFIMPSSDLTGVSVRRIDWVVTAFVAAGTGFVVYAVASSIHIPMRCLHAPCALGQPCGCS
jgi:hypothetical protein